MKDSVRPLLLNKVPKPKCKALPTWVWCGDRPVDLEIGCGVGRHPMLYTQRNLHRILIAIEKSPVRFRTMMQEVSERDDLSNLVTLNEHAVSALVHLIPERSIENVFFLYPNPYPKAAQKNLRWHAHSCMHRVLEVVKEDFRIILRSNISSYVEEAKWYYQNVWNLSILEENLLKKNPAPWTHFEEKYLSRGEDCFELIVGP